MAGDSVSEAVNDLESYLGHLRALPFVRGVRVLRSRGIDLDGMVDIRTPEKSYRLLYEIKRTFLDRHLTQALVTMARTLRRGRDMPVLLFAPYVPQPTGAVLAESGINFVDRHGNLRLQLGSRYYAFVSGKRRSGGKEKLGIGQAMVKVSVALLADERAVNDPVRTLARQSGVSKSQVSIIRRKLESEGILVRLPSKKHRVIDREALTRRWISGYGDLLRPRLVIGTYRAPERDPQDFAHRLSSMWSPKWGKWALTGGAAAYALDRFYRGKKTTFFVAKRDEEIRRALRLVPDPEGPIVMLDAFAPVVFWEQKREIPLAHPWFVYAELLYDPEPRAHEAAEHVRERYLK